MLRLGNAMRQPTHIASAAVIFAAAITTPAYSQSLEAQTRALALITKAADEICSIVNHAGNSQSLKVKGDVRAQLSGLIKQLADLGISGAADYTADQYEGVIQADLGATIQRNAECKFKVFDKLQEKMVK
jgi:hypothetical protein